MRFTFLIIPSVLIFQAASAQNESAIPATQQATVIAPASPASSTPVASSAADSPASADSPAATTSTLTRIIDYKSVFEAATLEEEVKMATERFTLTPSQQDLWLVAATDRRLAEKQAYDKLESKSQDYQKSAVYGGLRAAHNTFHETIIGHLSPAQKQSLENDRLILEEKRQRLAKMPPPPPTPTVAVATVDSAAIKEADKSKATGKKSKKKKKAVAQ